MKHVSNTFPLCAKFLPLCVLGVLVILAVGDFSYFHFHELTSPM